MEKPNTLKIQLKRLGPIYPKDKIDWISAYYTRGDGSEINLTDPEIDDDDGKSEVSAEDTIINADNATD
jgi:hypothetical protein